MDRRQIRTRKAIFEAFEKLLITENYNKITVQQIIDEANIGRTTFYAHFATKDALLRELCADLFEHVFSIHPGQETTHDFSLLEGDSKTIAAHMLYHLKDNGQCIAKLISGESSDVFLRYFLEFMNELALNTLLANMEHGELRVPEPFLRNHVSGAFVNMVQWWIEGGMKETPEDLADWYLAVITPALV